jgi:hypothetical protein
MNLPNDAINWLKLDNCASCLPWGMQPACPANIWVVWATWPTGYNTSSQCSTDINYSIDYSKGISIQQMIQSIPVGAFFWVPIVKNDVRSFSRITSIFFDAPKLINGNAYTGTDLSSEDPKLKFKSTWRVAKAILRWADSFGTFRTWSEYDTRKKHLHIKGTVTASNVIHLVDDDGIDVKFDDCCANISVGQTISILSTKCGAATTPCDLVTPQLIWNNITAITNVSWLAEITLQNPITAFWVIASGLDCTCDGKYKGDTFTPLFKTRLLCEESCDTYCEDGKILNYASYDALFCKDLKMKALDFANLNMKDKGAFSKLMNYKTSALRNSMIEDQIKMLYMGRNIPGKETMGIITEIMRWANSCNCNTYKLAMKTVVDSAGVATNIAMTDEEKADLVLKTFTQVMNSPAADQNDEIVILIDRKSEEFVMKLGRILRQMYGEVYMTNDKNTYDYDITEIKVMGKTLKFFREDFLFTRILGETGNMIFINKSLIDTAAAAYVTFGQTPWDLMDTPLNMILRRKYATTHVENQGECVTFKMEWGINNIIVGIKDCAHVRLDLVC